MKRSRWLILLTPALIAAGAFLRYPPQKVTPAVATPSEPPLAVRVEHEYVAIPLPLNGSLVTGNRNQMARARSAPTAPAGIRPLADSVAESASVPVSRRPTAKRASRDQTLFERARRAFVGDGRHRPEPFPKPRDN